MSTGLFVCFTCVLSFELPGVFRVSMVATFNALKIGSHVSQAGLKLAI